MLKLKLTDIIYLQYNYPYEVIIMSYFINASINHVYFTPN
jgi:hypothetical protein